MPSTFPIPKGDISGRYGAALGRFARRAYGEMVRCVLDQPGAVRSPA